MTIEILDLVLIGYGVLLGYLTFESTVLRKNLENTIDTLNEVIDKHNKVAADVVTLAEAEIEREEREKNA